MNENQTMFAEMLGIRSQPAGISPKAEAPAEEPKAEADGQTVDELDVQKEVVEEMAREKAELEDDRDRLETERRTLEERLKSCESELADAKARLDETLEINARLEEKLTRMGRALFAARRAAAEASKVVIGGRRW